MDKKEIFAAILSERKRQDNLHEYFPLVLSEQMMILMEEIGEVFKAINDNSNTKEELVQCAAVIVRILENWSDFK